ncbi:hypothetical protein VNO77_10785 [Canavalia gladiata]|uniref:SNRNP25 ubiquitin-like domain-containing protein n=1 Tax=Canavalia gladiata TaxID=3824 RepID=A0AAN9QXV7_CANGL
MTRFFIPSPRNQPSLPYAMDERSLTVSHDIMQFPSLLIVDGSFSCDRPPSETLSISILKLDTSSFRVDIAKAATVAELKQAVETVFSHMPRKGPGKISWSHVWGQFCLCYQGHKLVTETDYLRDYGIRDGDQLHFVRHVSSTCSFKSKRLKKRVVSWKQNWRSSSLVNRHQQQEQSKDDNIDLNDIVIENGKIEDCSAVETYEGKSRSTALLGGLFSYTRLARRAIVEGSICPSMITRVLESNIFLGLNTATAHSHIATFIHPILITNQKAIAMANMIMASTKPLIPVTTSSRSSTPKVPILQISLPRVPTLKLKLPISKPQIMSLVGMAASSLALAPPCLAETEKAALFDFNLTLPIIMVEFLLLMVALDKLYFTPLGKFMDERDAAIREKLSSVKDTSEEVKRLEEQANAVMRAARAEIAAALNKMKKETQAEVEQKIAEGMKKVEAELEEALANLEKQKEETIKSLDSQISALSQEIVKKVMPTV